MANAGLINAAGPKIDRDHIGDVWLGHGGDYPRGFGPFGAGDDVKPVNRLWCFFACHQRIERVQLQSDDRPGPSVFYNRLRDLDPENYFARDAASAARRRRHLLAPMTRPRARSRCTAVE